MIAKHGELAALVVGAGSGVRFGGQKQFEPLGGRSVFEWSLAAARSVAGWVVAVVPPSWTGRLEGADAVVPGGATRSASVRAGLAVLPREVEMVLVHDAARPLASAEVFASVLAALEGGADAAVPAIAVADTLARSEGGLFAGGVSREGLVAVQTPQGFRASALREAHRGNPEHTDDSGLVAAAGGKVVVVPGETTNFKITAAADLEMARALVALRGAEAGKGG